MNVLGAEAVFGNKDFAVMRYQEQQWMLHADHTYHSNPLPSLVSGDQARGAGIELRLYDVDPAEAAAAYDAWTRSPHTAHRRLKIKAAAEATILTPAQRLNALIGQP